MASQNLFDMLGGLGLFLFGMREMTESLELFSGAFVKEVIRKFTKNKYMGALVGFIVTAIIQSSSATTVIVVGMADAGLMALNQTVGIIMGSNIGSTVTGLIIAINLFSLAPIIIFLGVILLFFKSKILKSIGSVLTGLGILFLGMHMISASVKPISEMPIVKEILSSLSNPIIGLLTGLVFTAIVQSSSVSIGILEALGLAGAVSLKNAAFVIYGQNIGTCITALIASVGVGKTAKRTAMIHILFNVIGSAVFTLITLFLPFLPFIEKVIPENIMLQISSIHVLFNLLSTALLLPFSEVLINLTYRIIPGSKKMI